MVITDDEAIEVPSYVRLELVHAYLQLVAEGCGADILHIKGGSVHPDLSSGRRGSLDVDILVRPAHVELLVGELHERGWERITGFDEGSAFGHAMNLAHPLGMVDLHRKWPGFDIAPEAAFALLWKDRTTTQIAGVACTTPSLEAQRLILLLHYGRSGGQRADDFERAWSEADVTTRESLVALAERFDAHLALAAATGDLDSYRSDPGYRLWRYFSVGTGGRFEEWSGRWHAARGPLAKARVARGFLLVNDDLLRAQLDHEPTTRDYLDAYGTRFSRAVADAKAQMRRRRPERRAREKRGPS